LRVALISPACIALMINTDNASEKILMEAEDIYGHHINTKRMITSGCRDMGFSTIWSLISVLNLDCVEH
jgi:hypothetical protein